LILLIAPEGIEIDEKKVSKNGSKVLLIAPEGIEIFYPALNCRVVKLS